MGAPVAETQIQTSSLRVKINKFVDWIKTPHVLISIILMMMLLLVLNPFSANHKDYILSSTGGLRRIPG